jgi:hypothetical protein
MIKKIQLIFLVCPLLVFSQEDIVAQYFDRFQSLTITTCFVESVQVDSMKVLLNRNLFNKLIQKPNFLELDLGNLENTQVWNIPNGLKSITTLKDYYKFPLSVNFQKSLDSKPFRICYLIESLLITENFMIIQIRNLYFTSIQLFMLGEGGNLRLLSTVSNAVNSHE